MTSPNEAAPTPNAVSKIHANADTDSSRTALHHTLGISANQTTPGDHLHDGKTSKRLGKGKNPSFPSVASGAYNAAQIQAIIDALRILGWGT